MPRNCNCIYCEHNEEAPCECQPCRHARHYWPDLYRQHNEEYDDA